MSQSGPMGGAPAVPPRQHNLQDAADRAAQQLRGQSDGQLRWLGARPQGAAWLLDVLGGTVQVELQTGSVRTAQGAAVSPWWRILVLHYLAVRGQVEASAPQKVFADLPAGRTYAAVYQKRVIERLCSGVGRSAEALQSAASALAARPASGGQQAWDFDVFPRLAVRLVWYAGDEEFGPSACLLLPSNVELLFCVEDIVVLSECLVSRLSGKPL